MGGGVNGDNSDNHWTENIVGTADDRYINTAKRSGTAAVFATLQALVAHAAVWYSLPAKPLNGLPVVRK